jgi:hypothetical protein
MSKIKFKNLYRSFRYMRSRTTLTETLAWIGFYNKSDRNILERLTKV